MNEEYKVEILKKRIGELVISYEDQIADLRIANSILAKNQNSLTQENSELRIRIESLENVQTSEEEEPTTPTNPTS
jgi:hypothetical protein